MTGTYVAATTVHDAVAALRRDPGARVIAGGTDLLVAARSGRAPLAATSLVSIHALEEARGITVDASASLQIGALATHADVVNSASIAAGWTALADASALVGSPATRNVGTVGGNIMNASPAMELGAPLLVLGAEVELAAEAGRRRVSFADLLAGPGKTSAAENELLVSVSVPPTPDGAGSAYVRLEFRRAMEIAVVGAAALIQLADGAVIEEARIALTAVAPVCLRAPGAERLLARQPTSPELLSAAADEAVRVATPIDDIRASADYRYRMVPVMVRRALVAAIRRARGEAVSVPSTWSPLARQL